LEREKGFLRPSKCHDWHWGPSSLLYSGYQEIFSLAKRQMGHEVDSLPPPSTDLLCGVILLLPIVCLHDVDRDNLIFTFSIYNCALVEDNIAVCQREIVWKIVH